MPAAAVDRRRAGGYHSAMNPIRIPSRTHQGSNASNRDRPREAEMQTLRALERWENEGGRPRAFSPPVAAFAAGRERPGLN